MKRSVLPPAPRALRAAGFVLGIAALLWLPLEDTGMAGVLIFTFAICAWWGIRLVLAAESGQAVSVSRYLFIGAVCGLAVAPLAALLMVFKSGLHGHGSPDFSFNQILLVFKLLPVWVFFSGCIALGSAFLRLARHPG